ncbi:MAG: hypothetical protein R2856_20495 [Caldilineaceae bacterium]
MIVIMKQGSAPEQVESVVKRVEEMGYKVHLSRGESRTIVGIIGADDYRIHQDSFLALDGVENVVRIMQPFKLASRDFVEGDTVIDVNGAKIGGEQIAVFAGPCSVESREMILESAHMIKEAGATFLRGGAFKPRSRP